MRTLALLAFGVLALPAPALAASASTTVVPLWAGSLLDQPIGLCATSVGPPGLDAGTRSPVAFQGTEVDPGDCLSFPPPPQKVGGYIEPHLLVGVNVIVSGLSISVDLCPYGFETMGGGALTGCSTPFIPVALPAGSGPVFLSELTLPHSGFVRVCYTGSEFDIITGPQGTFETQDHFMAVTWDDLTTNPILAAAAAATGANPLNWALFSAPCA